MTRYILSFSITLSVKDSIFVHNEANIFSLKGSDIKFLNGDGYTLFEGNRYHSGASLYLDFGSKVIFTKNSKVFFSNNIANRYGGAIYYEVTKLRPACYEDLSTIIVDYNSTTIEFKNNRAGFAGNSIYFSISQSCPGTMLQYDAQTPAFSQLIGEIATSPNKLKLYHPAKLANSADPSTYSISDIILGEKIVIPGCVLGHDDMPAGSIQFTVQLVEDNKQNFSIKGSDLISIDCKTLQGINDLVVTGSLPLNENFSTIKIQLNSFYDNTFDWKPITVHLNVQLSCCHLGFYYSSDVKHCVCYTTDNIVTCSGSSSTIRNGYWFGKINDQPTVTVCPINYCNFDSCKATTGMCDLHPVRDNQCRAHRSGTACGNCEEGYTLSFDSIDCIEIDKCTIGQTVLVITVSFLYWIIFTATVFGMMYFKIRLGYLYGISFYYSVIDIVMGNTLIFSNSLYQVITTLSSVAKVLPQFLGQLCVVKGLSGIDQQFIHYLHPFAILLVLVVVSISTRFSRRLSLFVSRAVIHAICLLLLLSYSSIASTSFLLVRAISFTNVHKVYSYLSPDIEYFHGRHLVYGLIAIVIAFTVVLGLPLLLLVEPFLNSKINFIRIKPLLDQFQGCYEDKFRYFACYYMIFRLIILGIIAINESNPFVTLYLLQVICLIMILVHVAVKPYNNNIMNILDSFILFVLVLAISLQIVETYRGLPSNTALAIAFVLVILPLFVFLLILLCFLVIRIKKWTALHNFTTKNVEITNDGDVDIEMQKCQHDIIVDQRLRDEAIITVV